MGLTRACYEDAVLKTRRSMIVGANRERKRKSISTGKICFKVKYVFMVGKEA